MKKLLTILSLILLPACGNDHFEEASSYCDGSTLVVVGRAGTIETACQVRCIETSDHAFCYEVTRSYCTEGDAGQSLLITERPDSITATECDCVELTDEQAGCVP